MAHIKLQREDLPGIRGLFEFRPETAAPLKELAEVLLRGHSTLSRGERELIASAVSYWNGCHFCHHSHGAAAAAHLDRDLGLIDDIQSGLDHTASSKLSALLTIARCVQENGKKVTSQEVNRAKEQGASDEEIHDTVLIAAAFCMYNRYVDGLDTWAPGPKEAYKEIGEQLANEGYQG